MNKNVSTPPESMKSLSMEELNIRIINIKKHLDKRLLILGHHYQTDDVIRYADERGDSFALAKIASKTNTEYIVFCGVHFMAETADIVTSADQRVFIPDVTAGCFLADCARSDDVNNAWEEIHSAGSFCTIPITYVNSSAELKAFCGRNGGLVCTSSNAGAAINWAFERGQKVFFFPDQHLGRNTAFNMGIPLNEMILWDPEDPMGGNSIEAIRNARVILWNGYCDVHLEFNAEYVDNLRRRDPSVNVIVHPECNFEVAQSADYMGSTAYIIKMIAQSPAGSHWAVATEKNLVNRLKKQHPDKRIEIMQSFEPYCKSMAQITVLNLAHQLEQLSRGNLVNRIIVNKKYRKEALTALNRMLELKI
jgi:quinolinate synthase